MNKQGITALDFLIYFLVVVVAAILIIVFIQGGFNRLGTWVNDQISNLQPISLDIGRAKAGEELTKERLEAISKKQPENYLTMLLTQGENFYNKRDYENAKTTFNEFVKEYNDPNSKYKDYRKEEEKKEVDYYLNRITKISSAEAEYERIRDESDVNKKRELADIFLKNYGDLTPEIVDLLNDAKKIIENIKVSEERLGQETVENIIDNLFFKYESAEAHGTVPDSKDLIDLLRGLDSLRNVKKISSKQAERLVELVSYSISIRLSSKVPASIEYLKEVSSELYQLDKEARFLWWITKVEEGICSEEEFFETFEVENKDTFLTSFEESEMFEYVIYSYPQVKTLPVRVSNSWERDPVLSEAKVVLGWCKLLLGEKDYTYAYKVASYLEEVDRVKNTIGTTTSGSNRYNLWRESIFGLAEATDCRAGVRERDKDSCQTPPKEFNILVERKKLPDWENLGFRGVSGGMALKEIKLPSDDKITKEDISKYPQLGCWYGYNYLDDCFNCADREHGIISCGGYKENADEGWNRVCKDNPCGVNLPAGCEYLGNIETGECICAGDKCL